MGSHFDPDIVKAFLKAEDMFAEVKERFAAREDFEALVLAEANAALPTY